MIGVDLQVSTYQVIRSKEARSCSLVATSSSSLKAQKVIVRAAHATVWT